MTTELVRAILHVIKNVISVVRFYIVSYPMSEALAINLFYYSAPVATIGDVKILCVPNAKLEFNGCTI